MGKKKKEREYDSLMRVRKPIPKPGFSFPDKSKYIRKPKHKKEEDE